MSAAASLFLPPGRQSVQAQAPHEIVRRMIRSKFDAAQTTDDNSRHWIAADGLSADAAANPIVRAILRRRSRYECANNSYARGITITLGNDTIGRGPRLRITPVKRDRTSTIDASTLEGQFTAWAKEVRLAQKLRTMRIAKAEAGEAFAVLSTNSKLRSPVKLDIRLVEADQVASPPDLQMQLQENPNAVDGIVFDHEGNPLEYHILSWHPGTDKWGFDPFDFDRVPAESVIHYFRQDRADQSRGIPEITPALQLFSMLRRYTLAVVATAEAAASIAGVIETEAPAGEDPDDAEAFDNYDLDVKTFTTLPAGWKLNQLKSEQPTALVEGFKNTVIAEIARCLCMPFNKAAGNSSGYNYSSGQLDHKEYFKTITIEQDDVENVILERIFRAWLDEASLISGFIPQRFRTTDPVPHSWLWDRPEHADPEKEAAATEIRLRTRMTSYATEFARSGKDWAEEFAQMKAEQDFAKELGLELNPAPAPQPGLQQPQPKNRKPAPPAPPDPETGERDTPESEDEPIPAGAEA